MDFETVYGKYGDMLFRTAFIYVGDSHTAEDILQDVFIAYFTSKKRFENEEHRKAWLIRVTHNKCINYLRSPSRKNIDIDELQLIREENDTDGRLDIIKQIAALPASYKSVIILHYYNDYSVEEIAKILKMNKKDIKYSMNLIRPDGFMKTRIKNNIESHSRSHTATSRRLALSTVAACAAIIALGIGFGTNMNFSDSNIVNLSTNHANAEKENLNATDFVPETTDRIIYSQEEIEEELGYTLPEVQADPNDSSVAVSTPFTPPVNTNTRLIVLGNDISEGNHPRFYKIKNYVELPFTAIMNELADTEIIWISDTKASVIIDGVSYTLNIDNQCTLVKDGTTENIFTPSPYVGDAPYYRVVDGELIIDNTTLSGLINYLGHVMLVDYDAQTVTIV